MGIISATHSVTQFAVPCVTGIVIPDMILIFLGLRSYGNAGILIGAASLDAILRILGLGDVGNDPDAYKMSLQT